MNYEQKYKEALEIAKKVYHDHRKDRYWRDWLTKLFPELKESEDEKIRKELLEHCKKQAEMYFTLQTAKENSKIQSWITWLEKQDKSDDYCADCTNDKGCIACVDGNFKEITKSKFRIDDWIVQENIGTYKVIEVCDFWYEVIDTQNNHYSIGFDKEYMCHLWTIKDAKDGDVLAEDSCIFIIQKMDDNNTAAKTYCVLYDDGDFTDGSILYFDIDSTKPATKEQRELLFSKMKEAGYEWDSVKKELNEIEA